MKKTILDKKIFGLTFIMFFLVHGEMLFNKISWHDDVAMMYTGFPLGLEHGRWLYAALHNFMKIVPGYEAAPIVTGLEMSLFMGFSICLLIDMYEIHNKITQFAFLLVMISIPAVTGNLGYMGSGGINFLGIAICIAAAYFACKGINNECNLTTFLFSSVLFAISLGEYQCYFALYITLIVLYFLKDILKNTKSWCEYFKTAIYYLGTMICGLIGYLFILQIFLKCSNIKLTEYAGTNTYGIVNINEYISRIKIAYQVFFLGTYKNTSYTMFPFEWVGWRGLAVCVVLILCVIILILKITNKEFQNCLQVALLLAIVPVSFDFIFILYDENSVHSLHMYQYTLLFLLIIILTEYICDKLKLFEKDRGYKIIRNCAIGIILLYGVLYIRYDNSCYMEAEVEQTQAITYFGNLISRIQSIDNYKESYPVVFINEFEKKYYSGDLDTHKWIPTNPYGMLPMYVNTYSWRAYMKAWCNYAPQIKESTDYVDDSRVVDMPSYPDDGSIRIIDDVIVVKF